MPTVEPSRAAEHWDRVYTCRDDTAVSWFQPHAAMSIRLIEQLGLTCKAAVLDIGGGASTLVDDLLAHGFDDVTVMDISTAALATARSRVSADARVSWIVHDLLTWVPPRTFDLWHDRAVLHFLTADADRQRYLNTLIASTTVGSTVLVGVFAPDGPEFCSGLPVRRYTAEQLTDLLGDRFTPVAVAREEHITPGGSAQSFVWVAARRTRL